MLSLSISLNAVSTHIVCNAVFVAVAAIVGFMLGSIQTLSQITWLAWIGLTCVVTSCESCLHLFFLYYIETNDIS